MTEPARLAESSYEEPLFTVTDLKQWLYCPRIVYYQTFLPRIRPTTGHMSAGKDAGESEEAKEARRRLASYGVEEGVRHYRVYLSSVRYGLTGTVDMVIETKDELIPVDFKLSRKPRYHFRLQVAAYGLLLEEAWQRPVRRGFLYLIPLREHVEIPLDTRIRDVVTQTIDAMYHMVEHETMPPPTDSARKCRVCEFRRFCNDTT